MLYSIYMTGNWAIPKLKQKQSKAQSSLDRMPNLPAERPERSTLTMEARPC